MMVLIRRSSAILIVLILALTYMIVSVNRTKQAVSVLNGGAPIVIIDPGHGNPDGGAVSPNGTLEKDINLAIGLLLEQELKQRGISTLTTRSQDEAIYDQGAKTAAEKKRSDMRNRRKIINSGQGNIFVSIHMNSFSDRAQKGAQVFHAKNPTESATLAQLIQDEFKLQLEPNNKREIKAAGKEVFLLQNTPIPSVLVECGFLSNSEDEKNLLDEVHQRKIATLIADAIQKFVR